MFLKSLSHSFGEREGERKENMRQILLNGNIQHEDTMILASLQAASRVCFDYGNTADMKHSGRNIPISAVLSVKMSVHTHKSH